jgi:putative transposase
MNASTNPYVNHRYLTEIISHTVWLYFRFALSFRDIEEFLAARGAVVTYEAVRQWCLKFGQQFVNEIRPRKGRPADTWFLDEVFIIINGERHYLWRAVDQEDDILDITVQKRRDKRAAKRFFRRPLQDLRYASRRIVTDELRSYSAARKEVMLDVIHDRDKWQNKRADNLHQSTRQRERQKRRFKSPGQAQRFLLAHGPINNLFRVRHHHMKAAHYRLFRDRTFALWREVTCVKNAA